MSIVNDISNFKSLSLSDKISCFEKNNTLINSLNDSELNGFLRGIILDNSENSYLRKKALETFTECVFLNRIKIRQALTLLIDDWDINADIFLKVQRLKDLHLFYCDEELEIESVFQKQLKEEEAEIASEANFCLGLVYMQKAFSGLTSAETKANLERSYIFFSASSEIIENRVDAQFYKIVVHALLDMLVGLFGNIQQNLISIANILFQQEAFSFNFINNYFYLGFYRVLNSMSKIKSQNVNAWLDFRLEMTNLYNLYCEINNQILKNRLNQSVFSLSFVNLVQNKFVEPYFSLNFNSQILRVDSLIVESVPGSSQHTFLIYLKSLSDNLENVKKVEMDSLKKGLIIAFPNRSVSSIDSALEKVSDTTDRVGLLNVYNDLAKPSFANFLDKLIHSCILLQGNQLYRNECLENDRNTFIANLLEFGGNPVKDQTRWSKSSKGKDAGEIDIFIREKDGTPYTIIEALNLDSVKSDYLVLHLDKIFNYDTTGFNFNFILVYSTAKKFETFCSKYIEFISNHQYKYSFISYQEVNDYSYCDVRIIKAKHLRNGKEIFLYHLMVNLAD